MYEVDRLSISKSGVSERQVSVNAVKLYHCELLKTHPY